jgi:hypothetical protein
MVAITVILAAVIGAFVLEIGDQQETAPNASFDSEQEEIFICGGSGPQKSDEINTTQVKLAMAGGDSIAFENTYVKVNGKHTIFQLTGEGLQCGDWPGGTPVPDFRKSLGTNEKVMFTAGQSWRLITGGWRVKEHKFTREYAHDPYDYFRVYPDKDVPEITIDAMKVSGQTFENGPLPNSWGDRFDQVPIENGQEVSVIWKSSSGGKTQMLFRYTVQ